MTGAKNVPITDQQSVIVIGEENGNAKRITRMAVTDAEELECDHEEADSRMFIHAHYATESGNAGSTMVTSPDTDAAVLCLFHCSMLNFIKLWFHIGTGKKRRFIPMHVIVEKLSEETIRVLLVFHTLKKQSVLQSKLSVLHIEECPTSFS